MEKNHKIDDMKKHYLLTNTLFIFAFPILGVNAQVSVPEKVLELNEVTVEERRKVIHTERLSDIHNTYITAGRKSEVVKMDGINGNIAEKTGRQIFAKIPGAFVYDMDGSGNQINISTPFLGI
jgi:Fe(3+) dicitrate transport protein